MANDRPLSMFYVATLARYVLQGRFVSKFSRTELSHGGGTTRSSIASCKDRFPEDGAADADDVAATAGGADGAGAAAGAISSGATSGGVAAAIGRAGTATGSAAGCAGEPAADVVANGGAVTDGVAGGGLMRRGAGRYDVARPASAAAAGAAACRSGTAACGEAAGALGGELPPHPAIAAANNALDKAHAPFTRNTDRIRLIGCPLAVWLRVPPCSARAVRKRNLGILHL
ncbi:MAG: hypothetical protein WD069_19725 [Planctomycetales bacterium]